MNIAKRIILCVAAILIVSSGETALSASSYDDLAEARTTNIWIEGQFLGDMVIGATAQLTLIYMDKKACGLARDRRGQLPEWLTWNLQYERAAAKEKKGLFLIRYKTFKSWDFEISKLSINDYSLTLGDVLTRADFIPIGIIPSGTEGTLAVGVPLSLLKPGKTVSVAYGDWSQEWTIPKR